MSPVADETIAWAVACAVNDYLNERVAEGVAYAELPDQDDLTMLARAAYEAGWTEGAHYNHSRLGGAHARAISALAQGHAKGALQAAAFRLAAGEIEATHDVDETACDAAQALVRRAEQIEQEGR